MRGLYHLLLVLCLPLLGTSQSIAEKKLTFQQGLNFYLEGNSLFFNQEQSTVYPIISHTNAQAFAIGWEAELLYKTKWSFYAAVNYLYQSNTWQAEGLATGSDVDPYRHCFIRTVWKRIVMRFFDVKNGNYLIKESSMATKTSQ